jgi:hypothetical protein
MTRWQQALVVMVVLGMPSLAIAQAVNPAAPSPSALAGADAANPSSPETSNPANAAAPDSGDPLASSPANPGPRPANPYAPNPTANYGSNPANFPSGMNRASSYGSNPANYVSAPPTTNPAMTPQQRAAQQQSGLDDIQAKALLQDKGYRHIGNVEADPNSVWVWQADGMKDGRPVRVGIDYRGNVLDLSTSQALPCAQPWVQPGAVASLGIGSHLSQADSCSGR